VSPWYVALTTDLVPPEGQRTGVVLMSTISPTRRRATMSSSIKASLPHLKFPKLLMAQIVLFEDTNGITKRMVFRWCPPAGAEI
jgi:hypothetical protein